jgi:hypothetical protein
LDPVMTRTSTGIVFIPPTRSIVRFCSTRSSFTCTPSGTSSMSSRKIVPPLAVSTRPALSRIAPVKAPRAWPKSSASIRVSRRARSHRDERVCGGAGWCDG